MTKEELEKEAEDKAGIYFNNLEVDHGNVSDNRFSGYDVFVAYKKGALDSAEPREKQIQIDAEQIRALQKQNGELTDELTKKANTNHQLIEQMAELNERCSELEAQIEKVKHYLDYDIPHDLINEATTKIWRMLK